MGIRRRYKNIVEKFLSGDQGKRFFQFFYNWGATIVLIGVLAKLNHWPYGLGSLFLYIGLITEALVFAIAAFDTPPREYPWEQVFPVFDTNDAEDRPMFGNGNGGNGKSSSVSGGGSGAVIIAGGGSASGSGGMVAGSSGVAGGPVILGGGVFGGGFAAPGTGSEGVSQPGSATAAAASMTPGQVQQSFGIPSNVNLTEEDSNALSESIKKMANAADQLSKMAEMTDATQQYLQQLNDMSENMQKFSQVTNSLTDVSDTLLNSYRSITDNSDGITQHSRGYVQQMEALNRNISGLNTIYEIQLKSVSSQIDAIERINSGLMRIKDLYEGSIVDSSVFRGETEKMAQQLASLNAVYNRLLNAMTMNMYGSGPVPSSGFNPYGGGYNPGQQQQTAYNPNPNPGNGDNK